MARGPALALTALDADNDLATSWAPSRSRGTPGYPMTLVCAGMSTCDNVLTIGDALLIAQFTVSTRTATPLCPLGNARNQMYGPAGDFDNNGSIDIGDALFVAQCTVGLNTGYCE